MDTRQCSPLRAEQGTTQAAPQLCLPVTSPPSHADGRVYSQHVLKLGLLRSPPRQSLSTVSSVFPRTTHCSDSDPWRQSDRRTGGMCEDRLHSQLPPLWDTFSGP